MIYKQKQSVNLITNHKWYDVCNTIDGYFCTRFMKKEILVLFMSVLTCTGYSCKKAPKPLSREEIKRQVDSATNARINELYTQSQIDLERRIPIEVSVKADSIVQARLKQKLNARAAAATATGKK